MLAEQPENDCAKLDLGTLIKCRSSKNNLKTDSFEQSEYLIIHGAEIYILEML